MFVCKKSIVFCFQLVTLMFVFYMLITGIMFLSRDENEKFTEKERTASLIEYSFETYDQNECYNLWFLISFAMTLGAYWNVKQIHKFGVV